MGLLESLRGTSKPAASDLVATTPKTDQLPLSTMVRLLSFVFTFDDKFGRGNKLTWAKGACVSTGKEHQFLVNHKHFNPDYLRLAIDCHIAVEPGSNYLRAKAWRLQPDALKDEVIRRLEDPTLIPNSSPPLTLEQPGEVVDEAEDAADQVEIDTSPIHPAIPAMNQIIASVGREAKASGLVAAGYVFVDPEVFFES